MLTESQWSKIHRLARLKIEDASEMFFANIDQIAVNEMGSAVMGRTKESLSCVIRDVWISRLDTWFRLVIDSYMKALSSLKINESPEILIRILEEGIPSAVDGYKKICQSKWNAHERFLPVPFPYGADFDDYADKLMKKIRRRFDIRSLELAAPSDKQLDTSLNSETEKVLIEQKPKSRGRKPDQRVYARKNIVRRMIGFQDDFNDTKKLKSLLSALDEANIPLPERRRPPGGWRPKNWTGLFDKPKSAETKRMIDLLKRDRFPRKKRSPKGQYPPSIYSYFCPCINCNPLNPF